MPWPSPPAPTVRCGLPTTRTRSDGSPPPGSSPTTPIRRSMVPIRSRRVPTGLCGSPTKRTTRSGASPPPGWSRTSPAHRDQQPDGHHRRARRGAVVHQLPTDWQLDRAHHHRRASPTTPTAIDEPVGIAAGPDGALWFTNRGSNSIGRITTAGVVTDYTDTGITDPGITAGPDGALWFTNDGNNSIGRITTTGVVTNYTGSRHRPALRDHRGPDGALWFTNYGEQLDRADHHRRGHHQLQRPAHPRPPGHHRRARRGVVVHQPADRDSSGGSPPPGSSPSSPA